MSNSQSLTCAVIGAGQMGAGIAQVLAQAGYSTLLLDQNKAALEKGLAGIKSRWKKGIEKGKMTAADRDAADKNLKGVSALEDLAKVDLLIEAIIENTEIKRELFQKLDTLCKPETIFASNTSSISITKLAGFTKRPEQFIGMHFMNPVPVMQLVEIIRGIQTSDKTYQFALDIVKALNKTAVTARRDFPGFIVNRILIPMLNEATFVLQEGIAVAEEIDTAMKLGCNMPMGPLELADFVGLDTCLAIAKIFHNELGEDKYRPSSLLIKYVEAGWLGRKTGRGFYKY